MSTEQSAPPWATHGRITPHAHTPTAVSRRAAHNPLTARCGDHTLRTLVGVVAVWRDALSTFSAQSPVILTIALAGFWGIALAGALVSMLLQLDFDGQASALLDGLGDEYRLRALLAVHATRLNQVALIQAAAGMFSIAFARGVITWLALHGPQSGDAGEGCGSTGEAIRVTLRRYPALLVNTVLYGALITAGIVATSELTRPLEYTDGKLAHAQAEPAQRFNYGLRQLAWRGLNTLLPDPNSPFAGFVPESQQGISKQFIQPRIPMMALASVVLFLLAETLLRFHTVMAMKPPRSWRPRRFGWLTPLFASVRFGWMHFGAVTFHVWLLRLAIFALCVVFIELPLAMADNLLLPYTMLWRSPEVLPIRDFLETSAIGVIGAIVLAFSLVYDARLYMALSSKTNLRQVTGEKRAYSLMCKSGGS